MHQHCLASTYKKHERAKIRAYEQWVREAEHGSFTPLVMSLSGRCASTANITYKRLATMLAEKWEQPYCSTLAWMRCKLSFALLWSSMQCIRGARCAGGHAFKQSPLPTDLVVFENLSILFKPFLLTCIHFLAFYITRFTGSCGVQRPHVANL